MRTDAELRAAESKLASLAPPGGPTALLASLEDLAEQRAGARNEGLVVLFSDGRDASDPAPAARCREIVRRFAASRTRLCIVAVGEDPDLELLRALVPEGQHLLEERRLAEASAAHQIAELFEREIALERTRSGADLPVVAAAALPGGAGALGADVLAAQHAAAQLPWPTVARYVLARGSSGASLLWSSREGDPLLGLARRGRGECAALAFAIPEWASAWSERGDLLGPLVRDLGRGKPQRSLRLAQSDDEIEINGLALDAPALLEAWIFGADATEATGPLARILLAPPTAGADPRTRRTGTLPSAIADGAGELRVEVRRSGASAAEPALLDAVLAPARAPEFRFPRKRVARAERGAEIAGPRAESRAAALERAPHAAAPALLAAGIALLAAAALLGFFARRRS
jgi:hypothetical protein